MLINSYVIRVGREVESYVKERPRLSKMMTALPVSKSLEKGEPDHDEIRSNRKDIYARILKNE